jgi:hypothetical protein
VKIQVPEDEEAPTFRASGPRSRAKTLKVLVANGFALIHPPVLVFDGHNDCCEWDRITAAPLTVK